MQTIELTKLIDRGCWISDDRVYAFVSRECNGIADIGYHGNQPVSRNSRIFHGGNGVVTFQYRDEQSDWMDIPFDEVEWYPAGIIAHVHCRSSVLTLEICAQGSALVIVVQSDSENGVEFRTKFNLTALVRDVQGEREWSNPAWSEKSIHFACRDRIELGTWLRRTGSYAGDFLIPEPCRRMIFNRPSPSGTATLQDVRPEFRDSRLLLYDAQVQVRVSGSGEIGKSGVNTAVLLDNISMGSPAVVRIDFSESSSLEHPKLDAIDIVSIQKERYGKCTAVAPGLELSGYPAVEEFFRAVPGLVESCIVSDYRVPRACPGSYYWLWAWDMMVTAMEASRWRDTGLQKDVARFVNAHRDADGDLPGRWTRSLVPMDTPHSSALEFLLASLSFDVLVQSGDRQPLLDAYPYFLQRLENVVGNSDDRGMFRSRGFYPDMPERFGRTANSAVAMEVACFYSFCRLMERIAELLLDDATREKAASTAARIGDSFLQVFWDDERTFLLDAVDMRTNHRNKAYPLFTLLFLQSEAGWELIDEKIGDIADFIINHHFTDNGITIVPRMDMQRGTEPVMETWYPHWDLYVLKVLRRAGRSDAILKWLEMVCRTLTRLGYCPEFLSLKGFEDGAQQPWHSHGTASNLNCATGWYRAILEGIVGLEFGLESFTVVPLPLLPVHITGLWYRATEWDIEVEGAGDGECIIQIDGDELKGTHTIPREYFDGRRHTLRIQYLPC